MSLNKITRGKHLVQGESMASCFLYFGAQWVAWGFGKGGHKGPEVN